MESKSLSSFSLEIRQLFSFLGTTLGPNGRDRLLITKFGDTIISNDGAFLLKQVQSLNPIVNLLKELSQKQEENYGDGTTSIVLLACSFFLKILDLEKEGLSRIAISKALPSFKETIFQILEFLKLETKEGDHKEAIAVCLKGKLSENYIPQIVQIVSSLPLNVNQTLTENLKKIKIRKKVLHSGGVAQVVFEKGYSFELHKEFVPTNLKTKEKQAIVGKMLLLDSSLFLKTLGKDFNVSLSSVSEYVSARSLEQETFEKMVSFLKEKDISFLFIRGEIDEKLKSLLIQEGIIFFDRLLQQELELLSSCFLVQILSNVEELVISEVQEPKKLIYTREGDYFNFLLKEEKRETNLSSVSVFCSTEKFFEELKRAIEDAICVKYLLSKEGKHVLPGGGSVELSLYEIITFKKKKDVPLKDLIFEKLASCFLELPKALLKNSNFNELIHVQEWRKQNRKVSPYIGFNVLTEKFEDMRESKIFEPVELKKGMYSLLCEFLEVVIRIEDCTYL